LGIILVKANKWTKYPVIRQAKKAAFWVEEIWLQSRRIRWSMVIEILLYLGSS
jgi:hypothetical protein